MSERQLLKQAMEESLRAAAAAAEDADDGTRGTSAGGDGGESSSDGPASSESVGSPCAHGVDRDSAHVIQVRLHPPLGSRVAFECSIGLGDVVRRAHQFSLQGRLAAERRSQIGS